MSSILLSLPEIFTSYKNWVSQNPQFASDCETSAKWISYFIAGKINSSHVLSELVYCLSNLLVLLNDRIINNVRQIELPSSGDTLKLWLTVVEYCEVLFELSAQKIWGSVGKWLVVVGVQVFKCVARLILVYNHKENIIQTPPIPYLDRGKIPKDGTNCSSVRDIAQAQLSSVSFTLKESGRVIRKIDASPPISLRTWKPLKAQETCDNEQTIEQALAERQLIAETIYIVKPMAHLASVACFGSSSWKPWVISLAMDITSLQLYKSCKGTKSNYLTPKQRLQLSKRTIILVMYLLRSPFYDKYSKDKVNALLISLGRNVPLAKLICQPLAQYLPFWQSNYFYMWST
ncbi:peroxisomal membrane protein PEX16 [Tribolium castaneum]|uniref:Peroxisomal membrane protein PEX16 n=1 Tax=Tribolium castaneum TaxID=7070 RepID=D2A2L0_TRICA|nr:PREDICTED: peroxisomal membrane protein PEX16 [Tribolium castaneum]EFA02007.1 Peroxisomal membrane protein PEX16-like Protein [Tribolium castaneum]|eukprot:XP_970655.1 PREDICTED: peroxisomal membrane protein PEX16 [Tribolium castaneum]